MPALATISSNIADQSPPSALRRSRRRRKSTVFGLENSPLISFESSPSNKSPPSTVRRSRRRRKSTVHGLEDLRKYQMEREKQTEQQEPQNDVGQDFLPTFMEPIAENDMGISMSNPSSIDPSMGVSDPSHGVINVMEELPSTNVRVEDKSQIEEINLSQPLSTNAYGGENPAPAPIEKLEAVSLSIDTECTSSDATQKEAVSPPLPTSRLSLLMTLRPPPPRKKSILRRRCLSIETVNGDGTEREKLASSPTSDRHFDALATFEALSAMPHTETGFQTIDSGDEVLVIDRNTLEERLQLLFPTQFPISPEMVQSKRRGRSASMDKKSQPPCIFPRLVACYTIFRDFQRHQKNADELIRSPKRIRLVDGIEQVDNSFSTSSSETVDSLASIQNMLQKIVDVEWVSLNGHEHRNGDEGKSTTFKPPNPSIRAKFASCWKQPKKKVNLFDSNRPRIQFATSVVRAPSDVLEDSQKPQEQYIQALFSLLDAVKEVFPKAISSFPTKLSRDGTDQLVSDEAADIVNDFIFYLKNEFISQFHDTICVESLMAIEKQNIPVLRVQKAATTHARDLESVINPKGQVLKQLLASTNPTEEHLSEDRIVVPLSIETTDAFVRFQPLKWECRLADTLSQLIRYWLRTLMNENNERVDFFTKTDRWKMRLSDYVHLTDVPQNEENNTKANAPITTYDARLPERSVSINKDKCSGEDADEGSLSFLISNALTHIYGYLKFGANKSCLSEEGISWTDRLLTVMPDETCCATSVCQDGFGTAKKTVYLTDDDWQDLRGQIEAASYFCAFHRRALFVERLLSLVEHLDMTDYWTNTVQVAAQNLVKVKDSMNASNSYAISLDKPMSELGNANGVDKSTSGVVDSVMTAIQSEDEHLVLLAMSPKEFLIRLRTEILPLTCHRYEICRANLRKTEKKFRLGGTNTPAKKKFMPDIAALESYWEHSLYKDTLFPSISLYE